MSCREIKALPPRNCWFVELHTRADSLGAAIRLRKTAEALGWTTQEATELSIVAAELCTNSVRHAGGGRLQVTIEATTCQFSVDDDGPGFSAELLMGRYPTGWHAPTSNKPDQVRFPFSLRGGLDAAHRLSDELILLNRDERGATVISRRTRHRKGSGR
jgi:two-component sensor histidine kinase